MNRWGNINAGGMILQVGTENFPFPIPLQKNADGKWYFNTAGGADEILARRIGRNELVAMAAMTSLANAQQQYFDKEKHYAKQFVGDFAETAGLNTSGAKPQPFNGYFFEILTKPGVDENTTNDFTIVAYPAEYRQSGIMTFTIGPDGVIHQKDLGEKTTETATGMKEYTPDDSWVVVNQ